jgi:hypothetical protein
MKQRRLGIFLRLALLALVVLTTIFCFHRAALAGQSTGQPIEQVSVDVVMTINALRTMNHLKEFVRAGATKQDRVEIDNLFVSSTEPVPTMNFRNHEMNIKIGNRIERLRISDSKVGIFWVRGIEVDLNSRRPLRERWDTLMSAFRRVSSNSFINGLMSLAVNTSLAAGFDDNPQSIDLDKLVLVALGAAEATKFWNLTQNLDSATVKCSGKKEKTEKNKDQEWLEKYAASLMDHCHEFSEKVDTDKLYKLSDVCISARFLAQCLDDSTLDTAVASAMKRDLSPNVDIEGDFNKIESASRPISR